MTPEEYAAWLAQQQATNAYGSGPGYMGMDDNPYQRSDQRLNFMSDINRFAGIYQDDLLGLPEAPQAPEPFVEPNQFVNDLGSAYGSNPLLAEAFARIDEGMDPITVMAAVRKQAEENPQLAQFVPTTTVGDQYGERTVEDWDSVQGILSEYATNNVRAAREGAAADAKRQSYNQQVDEYNRYYNPQSEFDLMGSPELDDYVRSLREQAGIVDRPGPDFQRRSNETMRGDARGIFETNMPTEVPTVKGVGGGDASAWSPRIAAGVMAGERGGSYVPKQPLAADRYDDTLNRTLTTFGKNRLDAARTNMMPSQSELDNRKRLEAAYSVIFGEAPPTRSANVAKPGVKAGGRKLPAKGGNKK